MVIQGRGTLRENHIPCGNSSIFVRGKPIINLRHHHGIISPLLHIGHSCGSLTNSLADLPRLTYPQANIAGELRIMHPTNQNHGGSCAVFVISAAAI
jgi:hypothetical protein